MPIPCACAMSHRGPDGTLTMMRTSRRPSAGHGLHRPQWYRKDHPVSGATRNHRVDPGFESGELHWTSADGTTFRRTLGAGAQGA